MWHVFLHFYSNVLSQLKLQNLSVSYEVFPVNFEKNKDNEMGML